MAEQRHLLAGEEHVGEVLQRVDGDAALMHQVVRDRLAGDAGELLGQRIGVGDGRRGSEPWRPARRWVFSVLGCGLVLQRASEIEASAFGASWKSSTVVRPWVWIDLSGSIGELKSSVSMKRSASVSAPSRNA